MENLILNIILSPKREPGDGGDPLLIDVLHSELFVVTVRVLQGVQCEEGAQGPRL